jgi:hypothetical protein
MIRLLFDAMLRRLLHTRTVDDDVMPRKLLVRPHRRFAAYPKNSGPKSIPILSQIANLLFQFTSLYRKGRFIGAAN